MLKNQNNEYPETVSTPSPQTNVTTEEASQPSDLEQEYYSKNLKISFKVPQEANIEEKRTIITIELSNGKITILFNGTNFKSASEYYEELKLKNKLKPLSYSKLDKAPYSYVITTDKAADDKSRIEKTYFIYIDNRVYPVSASNESLYPILDQIVQSFEYKP